MRLAVRLLAAAAIAYAGTIVSSLPTVVARDVLTGSAVVESEAMPTSTELALFDLANKDRVQAGLPALSFDTDALAIARARAAAQPTSSALTHYDGSGKMVFADLLGTSGLTFDLAGENLARVAGPMSSAPEQAELGLMNSPTHRANILEPTFELLAVGSTVDARGRIVFAQVFRSVP